MAADRAFAALAEEEGLEAAYDRYIAEDAVQLPDGAMPIYGRADIMDNLADLVSNLDFTLRWAPEDAAIAASGDYGHTWGQYYLTTAEDDGTAYIAEGKYVNVWRKSAGGEWQVVVDISNENGALLPELPAE